MCETKTKKALFALLSAPIALLISLASFGLHQNTTYAASTAGGSGSAAQCSTTASIYYFKDNTHTTIVSQSSGKDSSGNPCVGSLTNFSLKSNTPPWIANTPCHDSVALTKLPSQSDPTGPFPATLNLFKNNGTASNPQCQSDSSQKSATVYVDQAAALKAESGTGDGTTPDNTTNCSIDGIGWLLCPVIDFGSNIADAALGFLSSTFLETNTDLYSTDSPTYTAWQWILGFANIIFVIIFLIIIFSQATGFGISNYGIKKMLPKLIIGVVLINLSFFICMLLVDLSNLLGYGFNKFFDNLALGIKVPNSDDPLATGSIFGGISAAILTAVGVGFAIYAALAFFVPVLLAAIVGLLMIFLFLVARQALIVLGIIIAPLAFAAWLLPNTEKLFKRWWSIFVQLLLLFPIVGLVYGASKLVSRIIASVYSGSDGSNISGNLAQASQITTSNGGNLVGQIIAAAVLVVPLFAVPFLLKGAINGIPVVGKLASRAYGNAVGGTNKRTKGITDPMFAGLRAQQRAGVRGWGGRNRVMRDEHGKVVFDDKGRMLSNKRDMKGNYKLDKNGNPLAAKRTISQAWNDTKKSLDDNVKSYDALADAQYEQRMVNKPGSIAGRAHRLAEQANLRANTAKETLSREFEEEKTMEADVVGSVAWVEKQRRAEAQAKVAAVNKQTDLYTKGLQEDDTLLNVAAGRVEPQIGRVTAKGFAERSQTELSDTRMKAARSLQGSNSEAFLQAGFRMDGNHLVFDEHDPRTGAVRATFSTANAADQARINTALKDNKFIDDSPTASYRDVGPATTDALSDIQDFQTTTWGAEALITDLAASKQLTGQGYRRILDNVRRAGATPSEMAHLVDRLNVTTAEKGMDQFAYSGVDKDGYVKTGDLKGGEDRVFTGFLNTSGLPGIKKHVWVDNSLVDMSDGSKIPMWEAAARATQKKINDDLAGFDASLPGATREQIERTAQGMARFSDPVLKAQMDSSSPSYVGPDAWKTNATYLSLLANLEARQKAARPKTQGP